LHPPYRLTSDEIGAALDRIVDSDPFRASPQLVAFLRFVVEATLAGRGERLKGYTIAVEALGRKEDFDPQNDPIVRVEAARLRRALERYYAETGRDDPIVIELPRGSYAPVFHHRGEQPGQPVLALSLGARPPDRARARPRAAAAIAILGVGIALVWGLGTPPIPHGPMTTAIFTRMSPDRPPAAALQPGSGLPVVAVQPFDEVGTPAGPPLALGDLNRKLRDALAQFDEIQVASAAARRGAAPEPLGTRSDYRLAATAEYRRDGAIDLTFRLHDATDGTLAWARTFADIRRTGAPAATEEDIVRQVATTVALPYGVIYARERALSASKNRDPRYRCLLETFDYRLRHDFSQRDRVRACLETTTALDPAFAGGFAALAMLSFYDYYYVGEGQAALDNGLKAAKRAIETDPESARAHQAMMNVLFARGQTAAALAEGEKAVALNSYDMIALASYGAWLVSSGEIDKGEAALKQAAAFAPVRPAMLDFSLFVTAYLKGDNMRAAYHASLLTTETYPFGLLARALVAAKAGDRDEARQIIDRLVALRPAWRDDPRAAIERYIRAPAIVERLTRDLADAGLGAAN
jgi:Tfp pilus assembly protein PilF